MPNLTSFLSKQQGSFNSACMLHVLRIDACEQVCACICVL